MVAIVANKDRMKRSSSGLVIFGCLFIISFPRRIDTDNVILHKRMKTTPFHLSSFLISGYVESSVSIAGFT